MRALFAALIMIVSLPPAHAADACASCAQMDRLAAKFNATDYMIPLKRQAARKDVPLVSEHGNRLLEKKTKDAALEAELRAFVRLVAASAPYDVESEGAVNLALIAKSHSLGTVVESEIAKVKNACNRQWLEYYYDQQFCPGDRCRKLTYPGSFEDCLLSKKNKKK